MKPLQFSPTVLNQEENCPEAMRHIYVLKTYKKKYTPKQEGGIDIHKALENRIRYNQPLPPELAHAEPLVASLEKSGEPKVEVSYAVGRDLKPVSFWDGYLRGKYDVIVKMNPTKAFIGDWKSGKRRESSDQLEIGALLLMANEPEVQVVMGANIWLNDAKALGTPYTFRREENEPRWVKWLRRMQTIEKRDPTQEWERREGPLCAYCPVQVCPHYRGG